jgi:hypothetical protein
MGIFTGHSPGTETYFFLVLAEETTAWLAAFSFYTFYGLVL